VTTAENPLRQSSPATKNWLAFPRVLFSFAIFTTLPSSIGYPERGETVNPFPQKSLSARLAQYRAEPVFVFGFGADLACVLFAGRRGMGVGSANQNCGLILLHVLIVEYTINAK